jgi:hypothetical protein
VAVALAEAMAKGIPGATVHVIVGEGHFANGPAPAGPSTTVKQAGLELTTRIEHSGSFGKMVLILRRGSGHSVFSCRRLVLVSSTSSEPSPDRMVLVAYKVKPLIWP